MPTERGNVRAGRLRGGPRKLLAGMVVAGALFAGVEGVAHVAMGPVPPSETVARIGICTVVATGLVCPGHPESDVRVAANDTRPRVIFLGGSTVRNPFNPSPNGDFPSTVARLLPNVDVVNLGVAGSTTAAVRMLVHTIDVLRPSLLVIQTGHNDYNMSLFRGEIHAVSLWTLPIERVLSRSWIRAWLEPMHGIRRENQPGRVLPIEDDLVLRVRADVDERFRRELTDAVRDSPAPVLVTTLLRNFDRAPTGVLTTGHPACADVVRVLQPTPAGLEGALLSRLDAACGRSAYGEWARAHAASEPAEKVAAWHASLDLDVAPLRAPASADVVIRAVARETGATLVDLAEEEGGFQPGHWFSDPLHPNGVGAEREAMVLVPLIRDALAR